MENFNWPIFAPNIGNFWKRWHMTLAGWCQAYIYMPTIGLTRNPYVAVYSTMLVMGLWHAGTFHWVFWGLYHATGIVTYLTWAGYKRRRRWMFLDQNAAVRSVAVAITFLFVTGGFAFTSTYGHTGPFESFRILAKLFFIDL
jgi:alginate O-acetyltransferase complex protein AlgI